MSHPPEISAIIVSWNVRQLLAECLASLQAAVGIDLQVVVVDNASADGSAEMVRRDFPDVKLIANHENRGFAAAVNQGIAISHGDIVLVNPDLRLQPDTLSRLEHALQRDPHAGIAGPRITYPDGQLQPSVRRFPTTKDLIVTLLKLPNLMPGLVRTYAGLNVNYDLEQAVDQVMGSCFLIRRATLDAVGRFDEDFYIWFEEVDYCRRALSHGWHTLYVPTAHAIHAKGASFRQVRPLTKHRILKQSMVVYAHKHLGFWPSRLIEITGWLSFVMTGLQQLLRLRKPSSARNL